MKVLTIMTTPFGKNGITNVVINYYNYIDKEKKKIDLLLPNIPEKDLVDLVKKNDGEIFVLNNRLKKTFNYIIDLIKIMKNGNYDIVHAHGNSHTLAIEMIAAKYCKIPIRISHAHSTTTNYKLIHKLLKNPFQKSCNLNISCGEAAGKWLFENEMFEVLDNGIEVKRYQYNKLYRDIIRKEYHIKENETVIGHIGSFVDLKNQKYLINLFNELQKNNPEYKLFLVGEGPLKSEIESLVKYYNIEESVFFLGKRSDVFKILSAFDLFIMPSKYEGMPLSLIEAQSSDLKCFVSSNVSKEINITGDVSFFDINDDIKSVLHCIQTYTRKKNNRNLLIGNTIIANSKYNIDNSVKKLENIYYNALSNYHNK